jgi:hypothetical protein
MLPRLLARFEPFERLDYSALTTLARHCRLLSLPAGRVLLRADAGGTGQQFLARGRVRVEAGSSAHEIDWRTPAARRPLRAPDGARIRTLTPASVVWVDIERVAFLLDTAAGAGYTVDELDGLTGGDWLRVFVGTVIGRCLSAAELARLLATHQALAVDSGQRVVTAGAPGDACYLIERGAALVSCEGRRLAELRAGSFFGEESLLSREPRNADVIMLTAGRLLRFEADAFERVVRPAVLAAHRRPCGPQPAGPCIDLDRPPWRGGDLRRLATALRAGVQYRVRGGTEAQRCHAAYVLAGQGIDVRFDVGARAGASGTAGQDTP